MSEIETRYPAEALGEDKDNGTMPENVEALREAVVGQRIVSAEQTEVEGKYWGTTNALVITLDSGRRVALRDTYECCAHTEVRSFLLHPDRIDHMIAGVGTTDGYETWHIYADLGDVLEVSVGWSSGNPFYYGYGFDIQVRDLDNQGEAA